MILVRGEGSWLMSKETLFLMLGGPRYTSVINNYWWTLVTVMNYLSCVMGFWFPVVFTITILLSFLFESILPLKHNFLFTLFSIAFFSYSRIIEIQLTTCESLETIIISGNRHHFTTELLLLLLLIDGSSQLMVFWRKNILKKSVEPYELSIFN